jgi:glycosyltransferase involved in cell wall biosynthesis
LAAHYRAADVLVCLSEHEGFCVPLLEAMHHEVPVVAYEATAVGETLGDGGILLPSKSPGTVAAAVHVVLHDPRRRAQLVAAGTRRMRAFDLSATRAVWRDALASLVS